MRSRISASSQISVLLSTNITLTVGLVCFALNHLSNACNYISISEKYKREKINYQMVSLRSYFWRLNQLRSWQAFQALPSKIRVKNIELKSIYCMERGRSYMSPASSRVHGRPEVFVHRIHASLMLKQELHHFRITVWGGYVQLNAEKPESERNKTENVLYNKYFINQSIYIYTDRLYYNREVTVL